MCGSSTHPGGGVMGAPGANAARRDPARPGAPAMSATRHAPHRYDCIVVGGGHNGLVCATYLARGGRSVLVLEAAERLGGAAVTREFAPGFSRIGLRAPAAPDAGGVDARARPGAGTA